MKKMLFFVVLAVLSISCQRDGYRLKCQKRSHRDSSVVIQETGKPERNFDVLLNRRNQQDLKTFDVLSDNYKGQFHLYLIPHIWADGLMLPGAVGNDYLSETELKAFLLTQISGIKETQSVSDYFKAVERECQKTILWYPKRNTSDGGWGESTIPIRDDLVSCRLIADFINVVISLEDECGQPKKEKEDGCTTTCLVSGKRIIFLRFPTGF